MRSSTRWRTAVLLMALVVAPATAAGREAGVTIDADAVVRYLRRAQKPGGGFGPHENDYVHPAWTYPAVAALKLLGADVPWPRHTLQAARLSYRRAQGGRSLHEFEMARLEHLLGKPPRSTKARPGPGGGFEQAEWADPREDLVQTFYGVEILSRFGADPEAARALCPRTAAFVRARQNPDGSFDNFPVAPGDWADVLRAERGHVFLTRAAVGTLAALGEEVPRAKQTVAWLRSCQGPGGGFTRMPGVGAEDVWETWAAVKALEALGSRPRDVDACLAFLDRLRNVDGGFGDRPGWRSRVRSTFHAVETLAALTGDARAAIAARIVPEPDPVETPEATGMGIHAALFKFSKGRSTDDVEYARELGLDLIGVNGDPTALRRYVRAKGYGIEIVRNVEVYDFAAAFDAVATAGHTGSLVIPPDAGGGKLLDLVAGRRVDFGAFGAAAIPRIARARGILYPEGVLVNEAAERIGFDAAVDGAGFMAIVNGYWLQDTIRGQPWREKYVGRVPVLADVDCHPERTRAFARNVEFAVTLFVARSNRHGDFLDAFRANRIVTVLDGKDLGRAYYGRPEWVRYVKEHDDEWRLPGRD